MRKAEIFFRGGWPLIALACMGLPWLAACGSADNPKSATSSYNAKARKGRPPVRSSTPGQEDPADMVAAPSASKAGPPVELKFALQQRPEVGQPLDVSIALIPISPALEGVSATFQATDGLDILEGAQIPRTDRPVPGTPLRHMMRIIPKRSGIFSVTAVVAVDSANQQITRTFSIPVIAGDGQPEPADKPGEGPAAPPARFEATKG